ncbi:universal stress protein [Streptomyces sp. NPDC093225]|uniref:universal stress protein n=1 Tax=Streptomyces sp. NPDC093225 TaxID=3366034 RepID=UPI003814DB3D
MISDGANEGPVVVAVDGSDHSLKALHWALPAARAAGTELVVAHVLPDHTQLWQARREAVVGTPAEAAADPVEAYVREHVDADDELPPLRFESLTGEVAGALSARAAGAVMLVLGSRGRGGFASLLLGSTSRACATTAPCPVVVVPHGAREAGPSEAAEEAPGEEGAAQEGTATRDWNAGGRVVLGVNPSDTSDEVVDFAFRRAAERGLGVLAVTAFLDPVAPLPLVATPMPVASLSEADVAPLLREIERAQQERLAAARAAYPDVPVENLIGPGDAAGQLVALSKTAALLVVGRHRVRTQSLIMGSVANAALQHAQCPVAVVPGARSQKA